MKTKKKENIIIIVILVVMLLAIIGVSWAAFNFSQAGNTPNKITTGSITMTYTESDNTISLSNALPTTDKTGTTRLKEGEYFDFTVSSEITGDVNINYEISAKEVGDGTIDGSNIKLYLTKLNGDEEEQLMSPEVYNEEASENTYTGRPAGEMSLYTSSMNSSESNDYRLRMYVTEEYNPQGDGGGLTFTVQVNVYGKAGEKPVPLTTQKILEDNELQEEKPKMFNYSSNGVQYDPNDEDDYMTDPNPEYITNGLYSMEDEDGVSYYYRGAVENNNVQFGEYINDYYIYNYSSRYFQSLEACQEYNSSCSESNRVKLASAGDKMYWKIVRVNGDGSLRLIYNGTSPNPDNSDLAHFYAVGASPYNLENNDPKYAGYTYDNGTDSFIKKEVDTWYSNTLGNSSYDSMVQNGRFCSDSSGYKLGTEYGFTGANYNVFASFDRLAMAGEGISFSRPNSPSLICPDTNETYGGRYNLKAGLITADELVLAGESMLISGNSYLSIGSSNVGYWSMTPADFDGGDVDVWYKAAILNNGYVDFNYAIRPIINVTTDGFTSGDGTVSSPYVIES